VAYPGSSTEDVPIGGPRFLDNRTFDGPIPYIVEEAVAAVLRNTSVRSFVEGTGRRDVYDYPVEALREVIVNALIHRDYSIYSRGTPVQIVLYTDRLTVANPGGLFGAVTEDDLGGEGVSSTRNPVLVKLLQDVHLPDSDRTVCENRASGIPTMLRELRRAGSALPQFHNRITRFKVVLPRHAEPSFSERPTATSPADREAAILKVLSAGTELSRHDIQLATGLNQMATLRTLETLIASGKVEATAPAKSPLRRYRKAANR